MHLRICSLVLVVIVVSLGSAGCTTPTSKVRLPSCIDRITVTGQHQRAARGTLVLDHSLDLPFSRTVLEVEARDGEVRRYSATNSFPDVGRLVGGSLLGATGGALLVRYGVAVGDGEDALRSGWFWALPMGLVVGGIGGAMLLTGWHPGSDLVIEEDVCREPPEGAQSAP